MKMIKSKKDIRLIDIARVCDSNVALKTQVEALAQRCQQLEMTVKNERELRMVAAQEAQTAQALLRQHEQTRHATISMNDQLTRDLARTQRALVASILGDR